MLVSIAQILCENITSPDRLHDEFHRVFGFPDFYGRTMDAWIDCMMYLDAPEAQMTSIHVEAGRAMVLQLVGAKVFREQHRGLYDLIVECSSFVNWRRMDAGRSAILTLAMDG